MFLFCESSKLKWIGLLVCHFKGDSGGPLVCRHNNKHVLYGLEASTGQPCDTADYPQIYMSVPFFLPWIKLVLQGGGTHWLNGTYAVTMTT